MKNHCEKCPFFFTETMTIMAALFSARNAINASHSMKTKWDAKSTPKDYNFWQCVEKKGSNRISNEKKKEISFMIVFTRKKKKDPETVGLTNKTWNQWNREKERDFL